MSEELLVQPDRLESDAGELKTSATNITNYVNAVSSQIDKMTPEIFAGNRADELRAAYAQVREQMEQFGTLLESFSKTLEATATRFRAADRT